MFADKKIGFIGGGNMGEALVKGLLNAGIVTPAQLLVHDASPARQDYLVQHYAVRPSPTNAGLAEACNLIILAVKPQNMAAVLAEIGGHLGHRPLIISIAAGVPLAALAAPLPENLPVIRVMPNTPALVLQGASALARGTHVSDQHMQLAIALFKAVGTVVEVEEKWMDAVTGLSGSGPGYFLLLLESFIDAGVQVGLPRPVARELVVQTALGTARMLQETGKHPAELKDLITSPGGTTIRGLQTMEEYAVRAAIMAAVEAATLRSRELGAK
jgi:pyrroline-5-carboxylate reductase